MDDDVLDDQRHTDAESFGEWIEQVADSRGVSEDELLHQLMSSYWMMDELAAVIDDLEIDAGRDIADPGGAAGSRAQPPDSEPDTGRSSRQGPGGESGHRDQPVPSKADDYDDGVIPLIETLKDWKSEREQPESSSVDDNLIDLIKVIQEGNQQAQDRHAEAEARTRAGPDGGADGANDTVQLIRALKEFNEGSGGADLQEQLAAEQKHRELADRIDALEAELDATNEELREKAAGEQRTRELADQINRLETELDATNEELHQIDQASQQRTGEVVQQLQQIDTRLDSIEADLEATPDDRTIVKLEDSLEDLADEITSVRGEMDSRFEDVDNDFQNVEEILSHLFDQTDQQSSQTEVLSEQLSDMESRLQVLDDLEAGMELQREANREGVTEADCESCGESVQIGQLAEANCPFCEADFDGVETDKKWGLFTKQVLTEAGPEAEN